MPKIVEKVVPINEEPKFTLNLKNTEEQSDRKGVKTNIFASTETELV